MRCPGSVWLAAFLELSTLHGCAPAPATPAPATAAAPLPIGDQTSAKRCGGAGAENPRMAAVLERWGYGPRVDMRCSSHGVNFDMPGPWFVDISRSGAYCKRPQDKPVAWRSSADRAVTVRVSDGVRLTLPGTWQAGANRLALPAEFAMPGRRFIVVSDLDSIGIRADITVIAIDDAPDDPIALAELLRARGCIAQAWGALRTLN
jgi:hypothetical protein